MTLEQFTFRATRAQLQVYGDPAAVLKLLVLDETVIDNEDPLVVKVTDIEISEIPDSTRAVATGVSWDLDVEPPLLRIDEALLEGLDVPGPAPLVRYVVVYCDDHPVAARIGDLVGGIEATPFTVVGDLPVGWADGAIGSVEESEEAESAGSGGGPYKAAAPIDLTGDAGPDVVADLTGLADDEAAVAVAVSTTAETVELALPDTDRGRVTVLVRQGSPGGAVISLPTVGVVGTMTAENWSGTFARVTVYGSTFLWIPDTTATGGGEFELTPEALGVAIAAADEKTTPVDTDELGLVDSADSSVLKRFSWANLKTALGSVFVPKSLYDANSIVIATADDTPVALSVAASRVVGRKATGDIDDMTGAETLAILSGQAGADFSLNGHKATSLAPGTASTDGATFGQLGGIIAESHTDVTAANTTTETAVVTHSIPGGAAVAGDAFVLRMACELLNNSGSAVTFLFRAKYGSTTLLTTASISIGANANRAKPHIEVVMFVESTSAQRMHGAFDLGPTAAANWPSATNSTTGAGYGVATESMATAKDLVLSVQMGTADPNAWFTVHASHLEILRKR